MGLNYIFLLIGVILSVVSKVLQFRFNNWKAGNIIVVPAAMFLCLALLFSLKRYTVLFNDPLTRLNSIIIAILTCAGIASFQIMMICFTGRSYKLGLIFLLPFAACAFGVLKLWFR